MNVFLQRRKPGQIQLFQKRSRFFFVCISVGVAVQCQEELIAVRGAGNHPPGGIGIPAGAAIADMILLTADTTADIPVFCH